MLIAILLGILILVIAVGLFVALGPDRFAEAWARVPGPLRTWINVGLATAITVGGSALVEYLTGADIPVWLKAILIPFVTSGVRAANPGDGAMTGGYGKTVAVEAIDDEQLPPVVD